MNTAEQIKLISSQFDSQINKHDTHVRVISGIIVVEIILIILFFASNANFGTGLITLFLIFSITHSYKKRKLLNSTKNKKILYMSILNSDLTEKQVSGLRLDKGEQCYFRESGWNTKTSSRVVGYKGKQAGVSIPIGRLRFYTGDSASTAIRETTKNRYDSGEFYITNNRLIYTGNQEAFDLNRDNISCINFNDSPPSILVLKRNSKINNKIEMDNESLFRATVILMKLDYI